MDNLEQEKGIRREKSEKVRKWKGSWGHCLVPALLPANKFQFPKPRTSLLTSSWILHVSLGWGGFRFICSLVCGVLRVFLRGVRYFFICFAFWDKVSCSPNDLRVRLWQMMSLTLLPSFLYLPSARITSMGCHRQGIKPRFFCMPSKLSYIPCTNVEFSSWTATNNETFLLPREIKSGFKTRNCNPSSQEAVARGFAIWSQPRVDSKILPQSSAWEKPCPFSSDQERKNDPDSKEKMFQTNSGCWLN